MLAGCVPWGLVLAFACSTDADNDCDEAESLYYRVVSCVAPSEGGGVDSCARSFAGADAAAHRTAVIALGLCRRIEPQWLMWAARTWSRETAAYLIDNGAPVDGRDGAGWTPLHYVFSARTIGEDAVAAERRRTTMALELIDAGAPVDAKTHIHGLTPLHLAAHRGNKSIIDALLARGADVNARLRWSHSSPLDWAETDSMSSALRLAGGVSLRRKMTSEQRLSVQMDWYLAGDPYPSRSVIQIGFEGGYEVRGHFAEDLGVRLVFEYLWGVRSLVASVADDGSVHVLWGMDWETREYLGLCRDQTTGLDHAMFSLKHGGACCGNYVEQWYFDAGERKFLLAGSEDIGQTFAGRWHGEECPVSLGDGRMLRGERPALPAMQPSTADPSR